ncbi:hypothetical protein FRC18_002362 [Serendipita sp. 400]|nr:hypothetical protein FRC18_002362 [Serendipita sp. 400]
MASTPSAHQVTPSGPPLSQSELVSSTPSRQSSIFLPSRSPSICSIAAPPTRSGPCAPCSPTVGVTMTPA